MKEASNDITYPGADILGTLDLGGSFGTVTGGDRGTTVSGVSGGLCGGCLGGLAGGVETSKKKKYQKNIYLLTLIS